MQSLELGALSLAAERTKAHKCHLLRVFQDATTKPNPEVASWDTEHSEMQNSGTRNEKNNVSDGVIEENRQQKWCEWGKVCILRGGKEKESLSNEAKNKECI